ncbi:hypothetical protein BT69DRAFT_1286467 [Atractiella rhizophila]|nr:hypothetical protein BT69DRAFT_1286467 [Atractiella rhizophila]
MQSWRGNRNNADTLLLEPFDFWEQSAREITFVFSYTSLLKTCDKLFGQNTFC